jgi:hypothetical protein
MITATAPRSRHRRPRTTAHFGADPDRPAAIRESADELLALVLRLREDGPIEMRGAALTALLVDHRSSPLRHGDGRDLHDATHGAHVALDVADRGAYDLTVAA